MSTTKITSFPNLQLYASFLISKLEDIASDINYIKYLRTNKRTFKADDFITHLRTYLRLLAGETTIKNILQLDNLKKAILEIDLHDVLLARKLFLLEALPKYTTDPDTLISLAIEIEQADHEIRKQLLQEYKEKGEKKPAEEQEILATLHEELNENKEELQAVIESLKSTNEELEERKLFIERITDTIPNIIFIFDLTQFKAIYTNRDMLTALGYTQQEVYAMSPQDIVNLIPAEDFEKRNQFYRDFATADDKEVRSVEFRFKNSAGQYRHFLVRGTVFKRNDRGEAIHVLGTGLDITEIKKTQSELHATLLKLKQTNIELDKQKYFIEKIINTLPHIAYVFDIPSFKTIYVNRNVLIVLGYSTEEILQMGQNILKELIHPDDFDKRNQFFSGFTNAGENEIHQLEYRIRNKKGNYRWILVTGTAFSFEENGTPSQIIGTIQDITALKQTETDLRQALNNLTASSLELKAVTEDLNKQKVFIEKVNNTSPNPIYIFDLEKLEIVYINRSKLSALGYSDEEIYQLNIKDVIPPEDNDKRINFYKNFINAKDNEVRSVEFRMLHKDGKYRNHLISASVFRRRPDGIPDQIVGISTDITKLRDLEAELRNSLFDLNETNEELVRTEEMLRELNNELEDIVRRRTQELQDSNERFELLSKATNDAVWDWVYGQESIWWNESFEKLFGYISQEEKDHPTLQSIKERIHPDDLPIFQDLLESFFGQAKETWQTEYRFRRSDNAYAFVLVRGLILFNNNKQPIRMVGSMVDISELKEMHMNLQKQNEDLIKTNADLDNFIYAASHDLKHPVTNLEGLVALLRTLLKNKLNNEDEKWLNMIDTSVLRLKRVILDIGEISKVQKGAEVNFEMLDFNSVLEEVKMDLSALIEESKASIVANLQADTISYERKNLRSILYNLLSNALKYRSQDRQTVINVETFYHDSFIVLKVHDNGLGLSPSKQEKLFTMFKRFHTHTEGSGIGLYMVKRIIENNGGKIEAHSVQNIGTIFTVYFSK